MTDEEKAEKYVMNHECLTRDCNQYPNCDSCNNQHMLQAYLDGLAEGRKEKCLEQNNDGTIRPCEVMKENEQLNRDKTELVNSVTELKNKVTELEKQIEKMKCCGNCKHCEFKIVSDGSTRAICTRLKGAVCLSNNYDEWELAE